MARGALPAGLAFAAVIAGGCAASSPAARPDPAGFEFASPVLLQVGEWKFCSSDLGLDVIAPEMSGEEAMALPDDHLYAEVVQKTMTLWAIRVLRFEFVQRSANPITVRQLDRAEVQPSRNLRLLALADDAYEEHLRRTAGTPPPGAELDDFEVLQVGLRRAQRERDDLLPLAGELPMQPEGLAEWTSTQLREHAEAVELHLAARAMASLNDLFR